MPDQIPVVPERNDFKAEPVFVKGSIADQAGHRPGYRRQWFHATNADHPLHYKRRLASSYVGNPMIGHCKAEGWTVVPAEDAKPGRKRDDDGKLGGLDTALTHGDLACMETPESNARTWDKAIELNDAEYARRMRGGDSESITDGNGRAVAAIRSRVVQSEGGVSAPAAAVRAALNR